MTRAKVLTAVVLSLAIAASAACGNDRKAPDPGTAGKDGAVTPLPGADVLGPPRFDGGALPTGSESCTAVQGCLVAAACPVGSTACEATCIAKGTAAAQGALAAVRSCEATAAKADCTTCNATSGPNETCATCLEGKCGTAYQGCGQSSTCAKAQTCVQACGVTDTACGSACLGTLPPHQLSLFMALDSCAKTAFSGSCKTSCTDPKAQACQACVGPKCVTQATACGLTPP